MIFKENKGSKQLMCLNAYYIDNYKNANVTMTIKVLQFLKKNLQLLKILLNLFKYGLPKSLLKIKVLLNRKLYQDCSLINDFGHEKEIKYKGSGKQVNGKVAVYTSVYGNYDIINEPLYISDKCDYFAITDQEIASDSVWKKLDCSHINGFNEMDNYHKAKFCKLFPHKIFPDYEYSIWIDGNAQIVADMYPLVDRLIDNHVMAAFQNPLHNCIYTERNFLIFIDSVNMEEIDKQINDYKNAGFPKHFGMREFSIIVRKHNDSKLQNLMDQWWEQVNKYTMRDQISFPYILWKNGETIDYIQMFEGNWRNNPRFLHHMHKWSHKF